MPIRQAGAPDQSPHSAFHDFAATLADVQTARSPRQVLGYLFGPPGWTPDGSRDTSASLKAKWKAGEV